MQCGDVEYIHVKPVVEDNHYIAMSGEELLNHYLQLHSDKEFIRVDKIGKEMYILVGK